jgi:tetratricopeptide (TPR) repeat protein
MLVAAVSLLLAGTAAAQDDTPAEMQCLRYLQAYERGMHVPQGLTTAISLVETGRPIGANKQRLPWPWTINVNGQGTFFDTKEEAVAATRKLVDEGQRSIDIGCMQINLRYHPNAFRSLEDAFDPAANVAYGTQFLASLHQAQGSWEKAIERYHSSDDGRREAYRDKVLAFWNDDVRTLVMNAVLAEDTNTPYHHAMRDFAEGRFADALGKYQALVQQNPRDRLGLLGIAMSYDQLGQGVEADMAYGRYIVVDPDNAAVLTNLIHKAKALPPKDGQEKLESLVKAGVNNGELYSALAETATAAGDNETAFKYAARAVETAPSITQYHLNAGVLADRLKHPAVAVRYYEDFLAMAERQPLMVGASLTGVRDRLSFLRTRL